LALNGNWKEGSQDPFGSVIGEDGFCEMRRFQTPKTLPQKQVIQKATIWMTTASIWRFIGLFCSALARLKSFETTRKPSITTIYMIQVSDVECHMAYQANHVIEIPKRRVKIMLDPEWYDSLSFFTVPQKVTASELNWKTRTAVNRSHIRGQELRD
jgi:hypothetical protein